MEIILIYIYIFEHQELLNRFGIINLNAFPYILQRCPNILQKLR